MRQLATLDGQWHFRTGQDDGTFASANLDDRGWDWIHVPGHWHTQGYPYYAGEAWYRTRFAPPLLQPGQRCLLRFDAVDYQAQVWLNGACLGEHEGYFAPFAFDVTDHLARDGENVLAVRVANPPDVRTLVKGALMRWDCADPKGNPGGIWQDVHLLAAAPTEFANVRTRTELLADGTPTLHLLCRVDHRGDPLSAQLRVCLEPHNFCDKTFAFEKRVGLYPGDQQLAFDFDLPGACLWWPWDWGHPSLYKLSLELHAAADGSRVASDTSVCGLRQVTRGDRWAIYLNGRPLFLRGTNYLSDQFMSSMTTERYGHDIALARGANINAFLPFGNVERPDFYQLCNEQGMAVMQYSSIQYSYDVDDAYVRRASRVLEEMVDLLGRHPCVLVWIMNGEPDEGTHVRLGHPLAERCRELDPSRIVQVGSHPMRIHGNWNEDQSIHDWLAKFCHYTGVVTRQLGETGSHSLVAEFGHQSLPDVDMLREIGVRQLWPPDWETIQAHNGHESELRQYENEKPPAHSIEELTDDSQRYQGEMIRYYIDHLRCHRFSRCNSLFQFHFVDCWPAVSWSVVDYRRRPKASYDYLKEAFAPATFVPDCPPVFCLSGEAIAVPLYAINDTLAPLAGCTASAVVRDASQHVLVERSWSLDLPANASMEVDVLRWTLPTIEGREILTLDMKLSTAQGEELVSHRYRIHISASYPVPLADPEFLRGDWSWFRHQEGEATVAYAEEDSRTFAHFGGGSGSAMVVNRIPLCAVRPGERLSLSLSARAAGAEGSSAQVDVHCEATEPVELGPEDCLTSLGPVGTSCSLVLPVDGVWHELAGTLAVPSDVEEREVHLACRYLGQAQLDLTRVMLVRSVDAPG